MLLIKDGRIFVNGAFRDGHIIIDTEKGVISEIHGHIPNMQSVSKTFEDVIDASGMHILPGFIDAHVHFRDPGLTKKEDFRSGSLAAANGGITHVIDMPNTKPPTTTRQRYIAKNQIATKKSKVIVDLHFGTTHDNFDEIKKSNPNSLKIYMAETTGNLLVPDDKTILKHFTNFDKRKIIVLHAEDQAYIDKTNNRDKKAALLAITRVNHLADIAGNRKIHVAHATTYDEVMLATKRTNTTVEVTPHHLFLSTRDRKKLGWDSFGKVYPPLRSEYERRHLWDAWDNMTIISTDHAPHTLEDKENGAAGFPGVETSFSLICTAYHRNKIGFKSIVDKMSRNPAKLYGFSREGEIRTGNYANITLVDINDTWIVDSTKFFTKS